MRFSTLFVILIIALGFNVSGQVIKVEPGMAYQNIGKQVTYFEDKSASLQLGQIRSLDRSGKFVRAKTDVLNLGNTKSAFWIKISYLNPYNSKAYLIVDVPNIEHLDCYAGKPDGSTLHMRSGALALKSPGVKISNNIAFDLPDSKDSSTQKNIYLRIKSNNIILLPLKLTANERFTPRAALKNQLEYMYIGILFTLFFFNIFLYLSFKDNTYLYYCLYVLSLFTYLILYLRGYSYLFGDSFRIMINLYPHAFLGLSIIASTLFCKKFLNLRQTFPKMLKAYYFLIGCALVIFITSILGLKSFSASFSNLMTICCAVVLWGSGLGAYYKGHKPAKYFIIAWFFIGISVLITTISMLGVLNTSDYTFELIPAGSALELLLLSFALGDRYKNIIKNEQIVRDENLFLVQSQNQRLEDLVEKRTQMLTDTIVQLEASNADKNKLFSIIAHDLRSPFNSLISIFSLKDMDLLTFEDLKMVLSENRKNIETIHNTLNNLLYWAKSQMEGIKTQSSRFDIKALIEDLMLVYQPLMQKKNIVPDLNLTGEFLVHADENQIKLILRNLIDNAIKFTPKGGKVGLSLAYLQNHVEISVINTILNPDKLNLENMRGNNSIGATTYGTAHEKGVGLGLHLCREYIKSNKGILQIRIIEDQILFSFKLPAGNKLK